MFFCFVGSDTFCALSGLIFSFFFVVFLPALGLGWNGKKCCCGKARGTVRGGSGALSLPTAAGASRQVFPALGDP